MARFGRWAEQAARDALLRYGPQRSNLADLIAEAQQNYGNSRRAARASATATKAAVNQAIPAIRGIYSAAEPASVAASHLLSSALAGAPDASTIKQGQAAESAAALQRLIAQKAEAEGRLKATSVGAVSGQQYAEGAAQQTLAHELRGLLRKKTTLGGEEATFAQSEADKLAKEQRQEEGVERRAERTEAGSERRSRRSVAGKGGKGEWQTADKQDAARSMLTTIEGEARGLRQQGLKPGQILGELTTEQEGHNRIKVDENGRRIGKKVTDKATGKSHWEWEYEKTPPLKAHDKLLVEAAIDSVFGSGHVSRAVLEKLHTAGYKLKALGLAPPAKPRPPRPHRAPRSTSGRRLPGR